MSESTDSNLLTTSYGGRKHSGNSGPDADISPPKVEQVRRLGVGQVALLR